MPGYTDAQLRRALRFFYGTEQLVGFAGGLNLRDALTELAANEAADLWNLTLDERGGAVSRLGMTKWNAAAAGNLITYGYWSRLTNLRLWYSKADGKLYSDPGTGVLTLRRTWTAGSDIQIVDFAGKVYAQHPVDGLYSSADGITWAAVVAASGSVPKGSLLAVWQNKLWSAGDTAAPLRLTWCGPGDATKWASADGGGTNDLREKDDAPIVALLGGSGFDFQTKPSLCVFKAASTYRVTDSSTGSYVTLDAAVGACGPRCVTTAFGHIYVLSTAGIFRTDGTTPLVSIGGKLQPLFDPTILSYANAATFACGTQGDRVRFDVRRAGSSANDLSLELAIPFGAFTAHSNAMACYVRDLNNGDTLIGASPTATGQLYQVNSGATDDGAAITLRLKTRVFQPTGGNQARVQEVELLGRGTITVTTCPDFATTGPAESFTFPSGVGSTWGGTTWGGSTWTASSSQEYGRTRPHVVGRAFQIRVDATASSTVNAPQLLGSTSLTVGSVAVYALTAKYAPLGIG